MYFSLSSNLDSDFTLDPSFWAVKTMESIINLYLAFTDITKFTKKIIFLGFTPKTLKLETNQVDYYTSQLNPIFFYLLLYSSLNYLFRYNKSNFLEFSR